MISSLFNKAKASALSYVQTLIDDQVTKKLAPYLATGEGDDGVERSDVQVDAKGDILIENCVLRKRSRGSKLRTATTSRVPRSIPAPLLLLLPAFCVTMPRCSAMARSQALRPWTRSSPSTSCPSTS